jgi:uncharacterized protein
MSSTQQLKIVVTGPMGAGKTTAIRAISDTAPVSTEVANTDQEAFAKESTTVGLDYGEIALADGTRVLLYGTPGQSRFSFMWDIIARGALGIILLIDASSPTALEDLASFTTAFQRAVPERPLVIGVGRLQAAETSRLEQHARFVESVGVVAPVFSVDVRQREDVLLLVDTLLSILDIQLAEVEHGAG